MARDAGVSRADCSCRRAGVHAAEECCRPRRCASSTADANGFRVGEGVLINTGQGWIKGTLLSGNGNVYRVRSEIGIDITKIYPDEVRRDRSTHGKGS